MHPAGSVLLDTSVVIDHFRGNRRITEALETAPLIYLPSIVVGELFYGAFHSAFQERHLQQLSAFLQIVVVLEADRNTAELYGKIRAALAKEGHVIPENDIWIAALAAQHDLPLVTRDQHFERISTIQLIKF